MSHSVSYNVSITVIDKISPTNNYKEFKLQCSSTDSIKSLRDRIHKDLNKSPSEYRIHIAYKGKVLNNDELTLQQNDIIPNEHRSLPKIYITLKQLPPQTINSTDNDWQFITSNSSQNNNNNNAIPTETSTVPNTNDIVDIQYENITGNEDDHKQCRLCFSSEEENPELGQLFQPCRCSGTMKWIHLKCLNEWRAVAPNARSYYRCDQCQYEYNLRRAYWADMVAHPNTSKIISIIILCIGIILFGILTFKLPFAEYIYKMIEWSPITFFSNKLCRNKSIECMKQCNSWLPWNYCPYYCFPCYLEPLNEWTQIYIQVFFSGVLLLSCLGLFAQRQLIWRHKWIFIVTLAQSTRVWRLFILVGVGHSFYGLLNTVRIVVKKFLSQFGEKILSVDHTINTQ
eukprot:230847_1